MRELRATAATFSLALLVGATFWILLPRTPPPHPAVPQTHRDNGYLGSGACRSCHPSEHKSWSATYHRTMTRPAAALPWTGERGPALPITLSLYGREFRLDKLGSSHAPRVSYRGPDLHAVGRQLPQLARASDASRAWKQQKAEELFRSAPEVDRELVMLTGSHHYLAFWIEGGDDAELRQFPFVYLLDEARWLPRKDAFLQPPDALPHIARWNSNCIQCHAVAGQPRQTEGRDQQTGAFWESFDTSIAEEGISCEACHGPGKQHATHYRNPVARASARAEGQSAHIFVPGPEAGARGSEVCGQCHSYFVPKSPDDWWSDGFSAAFQAGEPLSSSRAILRAEPRTEDEKLAARAINQDLRTIFWEDGSIIVGGREFNGLTKSPCFERGEGEKKLACTSCHSMHEGDPNQQIAPEARGDAMCTQCHESLDPAHTRHQPDSPGTRCVSCHMPRTSYALLHGIPSHQISSPAALSTRPPNACSLCHVDRSAAWIATEMRKFGSSEEPIPPPPSSAPPLAVERALSGNAAERALFAYALGTHDVWITAGPAVARALLPWLEKDPYSAVRLIAERAQRSIDTAAKEGAPGARAQNKSLPQLNNELLSELVERRDNTPIVISE